jgi:hypothetical protein
MAITDVINGSDVLVFISPSTGATTWKTLGHATSHSLSIKVATRDTSNKGSGNYVTKAAGRIEVTGTMEGLYVDSDQYNLEDLKGLAIARVPVLMIFGRETTSGSGTPDTTTSGGSHFYSSGKFIITGVDETHTDGENSTYTCTFEHFSGFEINNLITS